MLCLEYKNGQTLNLLSHNGKLYNPIKNYSYDDIVFLNRPVSGRVSSDYGWRLHPVLKVQRMHTGVDYASPMGTPIYAQASGIVDKSVACNGYGNFVEVAHMTHKGKLTTGYAHLKSLILKKNQKIKKGDLIGYVGNTGITTSAHLHYEIRIDGKTVHPTFCKKFLVRDLIQMNP